MSGLKEKEEVIVQKEKDLKEREAKVQELKLKLSQQIYNNPVRGSVDTQSVFKNFLNEEGNKGNIIHSSLNLKQNKENQRPLAKEKVKKREDSALSGRESGFGDVSISSSIDASISHQKNVSNKMVLL